MNRTVILETERLVLRPFRPDDAEALFRCLGDPALLEFKPFHPYSSTQCAEIARKRSKDNSYRAICLKGGPMIGEIFLTNSDNGTMEIGFIIERARQNFGYATEAASEVIDFAFRERAAKRIVAVTGSANLASRRVLEKCHMRLEDVRRQNTYLKTDENGDPVWEDTCVYALLRNDWTQLSG